jgi:hypothetical protein
VLEGEEVAWQVDPDGRDNLQAPRLLRYIATLYYIFKRSKGNSEENTGCSSEMEMRGGTEWARRYFAIEEDEAISSVGRLNYKGMKLGYDRSRFCAGLRKVPPAFGKERERLGHPAGHAPAPCTKRKERGTQNLI